MNDKPITMDLFKMQCETLAENFSKDLFTIIHAALEAGLDEELVGAIMLRAMDKVGESINKIGEKNEKS